MSINDIKIPSTTLAELRGVLVRALSRENLSVTDKIAIRKSQSASTLKIHYTWNYSAGNKDTSNMQQSQQQPCRPGSANKDHSLTQKEREERIKQLKDKQNEERQRKLEELKAQALATQKFREQKDEERRRRIDELKMRDTDKRQQVEDRKKAIWEAEKERREYILRKNQERDQRLESKRKNERSQIAFAFGSSTPRMMDTESGANWAHRSISSLTRRSSVRELNDGTAKKRAISASGLDRQSEAQKRMSTSMHEVFHWGRNTSAAPKKLSLSVAGSQIDFEGPPSPRRHTPASQYSARNRHSMVMVNSKQDDSCESSFYQTYNVHRRKTDLMPTIPSPRDTTRSSLGNHTPRTPGRAFSMTRLDQLAQPKRRNGEHISAILERERRQAIELENLSRMTLSQTSPSTSSQDRRKSRSMSQLARRPKSRDGSRNSQERMKAVSPLQKHHKNADATRSMTQLTNGGDKKFMTPSPAKAGLRSGEITPKSLSASRPGSAMSTSTANSGLVTKRPTTSQRKARPISIAVTGVSKDEKPLAPLSANKPIKRTPSAPSTRTSETIKNRPSSAKATPGATPKSNTPAILSPSTEVAPKIVTNIKEPEPVQDDSIKNEKTIINNVIKAEQQHTEESINGGDIQVSASSMESKEVAFEVVETIVNTTIEESKLEKPIADVPVVEEIVESQPSIPKQEIALEPQAAPQKEIIPVTQSIPEPTENPEMTSSMMSKSRITTEEEAKAAIAERRRLAREEAERQAEIERKRLEAEEEAEYQRQLEEEERQREFELETIRLAEEQKRLEAERLEQAIEDNLKREEAEKQRLEEEARLKVEREIAERKAREDAEKLKIETAERLRKEEKEREERRKRVEAIMARTRKGGSTNTPSKNDGDGVDMTKSQIDSMSQSIIEQTLDSEQSTADQSSQQVPSPNDYEQSVTEKENLLMSSFNKMNLNLNGNGLNNNLLEANNNFNLLSNGQQNGKSDVSTDLIIDANATTNGLNSIDSAFKSTIEAPSDVTQKSQDQLIDFGSDATTTALSDDAIINVNNNFIDNSNSSLMTHNNLNNNNNNNLTMLVAASEHDNDDRDLSLL